MKGRVVLQSQALILATECDRVPLGTVIKHDETTLVQKRASQMECWKDLQAAYSSSSADMARLSCNENPLFESAEGFIVPGLSLRPNQGKKGGKCKPKAGDQS